jgi:ADP-heptose:LPS heptosyltransferase
VLIVRLDAIGDALVTVPLAAALRAAGFSVSAVLSKANAQAFSPQAMDRVHVGLETVAEIRSQRYDVALIPSEEPEAYELARDASIPQRIGFWHGLRAKPFKSLWIRRQCTRVVYRPGGLDTHGMHECEVVFQLARTLLPGQTPSRDAAILRPLVIGNEPAGDTRVSFQVTDKWTRLGASFEDVVAAAGHARERHELRFIAAASERTFADRFARAASVPIDFFDTLPPWKEAIAASRALIAPDSGAVHVAGMTGTPVVAVYEPDDFVAQTNRWGPWAAPSQTIRFKDEWPRRVYGALDTLLNETAAV